MGYGKNLIERHDKNCVFSDEQKEVLGKSIEEFVQYVDEWMYSNVLPKTINADNEHYGNNSETSLGIIKKVKMSFE
jgi:hypothetical protein